MPLILFRSRPNAVCIMAAALFFWISGPHCVHAISIELRDEAPDRIERQKAAATGKLPLPGTPDTAQFTNRMTAQGLKPGLPMLIRIFKAQSELEVWMDKDGAYVLFATYPICHWSGTLGPKIREGDKQTPEGFYTITARQLHRLGRWTRALNLGFPNAFDESLKRDGSYILVHGGCSSVGCFAMTNPVIEEIYSLTSAALRAGQRYVPVHVFPFRMTDANLDQHKTSEWRDFWLNLKEGYDAFERTKRPPYVSVCDGRYRVETMNASPPEAGAPGPLAVCGPTAAALLDLDKSAWLVPLETAPMPPSQAALTAGSPSLVQPAQQSPANLLLQNSPAVAVTSPQFQAHQGQPPLPRSLALHSPATPDPPPAIATSEVDPLMQTESRKAVASVDPALAYELIPRLVALAPRNGIRAQTLPCNLTLASCRKYAALLANRGKHKGKIAASARVRTASRSR
ncbi:MAG: L,D-transpeptidase family protein [Hyphomicrobium sp.]